MQKVAWPMMIVHCERRQPSKLKNESMATPVTMPGRVIGRTMKKRIAGLPGKSVAIESQRGRGAEDDRDAGGD